MAKLAPKSQGCLGSGAELYGRKKGSPTVGCSLLPREDIEDAGSHLPKQSVGLAWKGSKDNNPEREGTKTGDNPREI